MKRRGFFKLFAAATAAVAMEVCGLKPIVRADVVNDLYENAAYESVLVWHPKVGRMIQGTLPTGWAQNFPVKSVPIGSRWDVVDGQLVERKKYMP